MGLRIWFCWFSFCFKHCFPLCSLFLIIYTGLLQHLLLRQHEPWLVAELGHHWKISSFFFLFFLFSFLYTDTSDTDKWHNLLLHWMHPTATSLVQVWKCEIINGTFTAGSPKHCTCTLAVNNLYCDGKGDLNSHASDNADITVEQWN